MTKLLGSRMDVIRWFEGDNGIHYARNPSVSSSINVAVLWYDVVNQKAILHRNGRREEYATVEAAKVALELTHTPGQTLGYMPGVFKPKDHT